MQKGLFLVVLYAAFEFTVTRIVSDMANYVSGRSIPCEHIDRSMLPLALDPQFKSVATPAKRSAKWEKRTALVGRIGSSSTVRLHDESLTEELGNVWPNALRQIFQAFGLSSSPFHSSAAQQYIHDLVDRRNAIAHGRESAVDIGQAYSSPMLERLFEELEKSKDHLFAEFDNFLSAKSYVDSAHRAAY